MARLPVDIAELSNRNELPTGAMQVQEATARNAGGQAAAALGGLGDAVSGLALKIEANKRQSTGFDIEQKFIALQEEDAQAYEESKRGLAGSGDGFWDASRKATSERYDAFVDSLPKWAQDEYRTKAEAKKAQRSTTGFQDQYAQQDNNSKAVLSEESRKAGLAVQESPESFEEYRQRQYGLIDKSTLPAAEKEALKLATDNALAATAAESAALNDPGGALAGSIQPGAEGVKSLIRKKEGFRTTAYWDVTAWRTGYGSDTYTTADGVVHKVTKDSVITQEDAERDLDRRINTEFMPAAIGAAGADAWSKLSPAAQAVMTSLSYNYGAGAWSGRLSGVAAAAKSGNPETLAAAVRNLAGDNGGVNAGRRNSEADLVLAGKGTGGPPPAYLEYLTPDQKSAYDRTAERAFQGEMDAAQAVADAQRKASQDAAMLAIMEGPDPQGAYDNARKSGMFDTPEEVKRADAALKERTDAEGDAARAQDIMGGAVPASRTDAKDKKTVNTWFNNAVKAGVSAMDAASAAFDKTGVVPTDFARGLIGGAGSRDPTQVEGALTAAGNLLGKDPNAFNGVANSKHLVDDAVEFNRRTQQLGESSEDAVKAILADRARPAVSAALQDEALKGFRKDTLTPAAVEAGLATAAENGWGADAAVPSGAATGGDAMRSIYRGLAEEGFRKFGDADRAMNYAAVEVGRRFGVFNGTLTQYPPDKAGVPALPKSNDPYAWVAEQAASAATEALGVDVPPGQVVLVPVEQGGVSTRAAFTGTPTPIPGKTGKATVPYSVVVLPEDGSAPMVVPGVFLPDIEEYVAAKNAEPPPATEVLPRGGVGVGVGYQGVDTGTAPAQTPEQAAAEALGKATGEQQFNKVQDLRGDAAVVEMQGNSKTMRLGPGARNQDF